MNIGAEIVGLKIGDGLEEAASAAIRQSWLEHGLIIFRDMHAGNAEHLSLSRCFGELEQHPVKEFRHQDEPNLIELGRRNFGRAYVYNGSELRLGRFPWHRDTSFTTSICKGAVLRMEEIPPENGETRFADTAKAYDALPEEMKDTLSTMEFVTTWRGSNLERSFGSFWGEIRSATQEEHAGKDAMNDSMRDRFPPVVHPAIVAHPETGRKSIYICPNSADYILGMTREESHAFIEQLVVHMTDEQFCYTHSWRPGDMIAWDNRRCLHSTLGYHPQYMRTGYRTTLAGPLVTGRYLEQRATA